MPPVRLGAIGFVNTLPVTLAFAWPPGAPQGVIRTDAPAALNRAILSGALDVSPVSSACYLRHQNALTLLPGLSVSSPGAVESVLFLSRQTASPIIPVPDDSETSIALLRHMLQVETGDDGAERMRAYPAHAYGQALEAHGCALIIGDRALRASESAYAREPWRVSDLSSWWRAQTGLPFVFAVWAVRREFAQTRPDACHAIAEALRQSRDRFFSEPALFERGVSLASAQSGVSPTRLRRYYRHALTYDLTPEHHQSLSQFAPICQALAAQLPVLPPLPERAHVAV